MTRHMTNLHRLHDAKTWGIEDAPRTPDTVILERALGIICSHGDSAVEYANREMECCGADLRVQAQWVLIRRRIERLLESAKCVV